MIQRRLAVELEKVAHRFRRFRLFGVLAINWLVAALVGVLLLWRNWNAAAFSPWVAVGLAGASLLTALVAGWLCMRSARDERWVARKIEARHPTLQKRLLTAVEQRPDAESGRFGYLQETVMREALEHNQRYHWDTTLADSRLAAAQISHFGALSLFGVVLVALAMFAFSRDPAVASKPLAENAALAEVGRYRVEVKPGDAEIERGTSLVVVARFEGELPPGAELLVQTASGKTESLAMSRSLDDPLFGARVATIEEDLTYRVAFEGQQTEPYRVTVFEYPALERADARLKFPEYTSMQEKVVEDTRRVTAVEGTKLTWVLRLNKPVDGAWLESPGAEPLLLQADPADPKVYTAAMTLTESRRYRVHLKDDQGRANKEPPELAVNVVPNRPPEIEIVWPKRDSQVSPLEEFDVEATAWDDFGLARYGLVFSHAGSAEQEVVLGAGGGPKEKRALAHLIDLEALQAEPDQLLSYYFFAEDYGPDGAVRRVLSDMYFAEVRRYEEIFRQAEQPAGGEEQQQRQQQQQQQQAGQNAQRAEQLADLQKQIITATWNLIRRERPDRLTPQFVPDVRLLVESQGAALEQLEELAGRVEDEQSQTYVEEVKQHMVAATQQLLRAVDESSPEPLRAALPEEQAAYQGLLKLRAREFQVMRSNSRQQQQQQNSSNPSASARQQQLNQLELRQDENRYETQRTAQDQQQSQQQQQQQQREVQQALNRLKELARRQEDLNKQLQELQSALEQARTEEEKEEIQRRLKRLRDEQQQMLRDVDELRERLDESQNPQDLAEEQQRLAETRENVRQASEALEQGRVSQALAEGTRAQREFEELRDEFRRRAAGQFDEQMRQMREAARELEDRENQLAERMQQLDQPDRPRSLRDANEKQQIAQGFQEQKENLQDLLRQMEEVVRQAEQPEPLLADRLYDTLRTTRQEKVENALETARQLSQAGLAEQAAVVEEVARAGIQNLRQGVERAAQSVLGDETEALERAQATLEDLTRQLEREAEARSREARERSGQPSDRNSDSEVRQASYNEEISQQQGQNQQGQNQQGQNQQGQNQQGQNQQGQNQQGQNQQGQNQQGQNQQGQNQQGQNQQGQNQQGQNQQGQNQQGQNQQGQNQQGQNQQGQNQQGQNQQGQNQQGQNQQGQNQQGQNQQGQNQQGQNQEGERQPGGEQRNQDSSAPRAPRSLRGGPQDPRDGRENPQQDDFTGSSRAFEYQGGPMNPLTGENFREWSDRLRDVEEMLDDPRMRSDVAEVRDRAREMRIDYTRHSKEPNWDLVRLNVIQPLTDLRNRVAEELIRRQAKDSLTPIDRDPVPPQFAEPVRRYYEELGRGE